jgi:hypothetical protein
MFHVQVCAAWTMPEGHGQGDPKPIKTQMHEKKFLDCLSACIVELKL